MLPPLLLFLLHLQIEGGWKDGGKSPSIWDTLTQKEPSIIMDNTTGNVAVDHFNRWEEDVALMKRLGVKHYRCGVGFFVFFFGGGGGGGGGPGPKQ
jgi:beta-glucosidase/6-phospho-beta-glucosidase/beta-galactosidase